MLHANAGTPRSSVEDSEDDCLQAWQLVSETCGRLVPPGLSLTPSPEVRPGLARSRRSWESCFAIRSVRTQSLSPGPLSLLYPRSHTFRDVYPFSSHSIRSNSSGLLSRRPRGSSTSSAVWFPRAPYVRRPLSQRLLGPQGRCIENGNATGTGTGESPASVNTRALLGSASRRGNHLQRSRCDDA